MFIFFFFKACYIVPIFLGHAHKQGPFFKSPAREKNGITAFLKACFKGNLDMARVLKERTGPEKEGGVGFKRWSFKRQRHT